MPRPRKCKKVCQMPKFAAFSPVSEDDSKSEPVTMTVEEYETIRLIDHRGFTQAECSEFMGIARTTVQNMYDSARKKIAAAVVDGHKLIICGGNFRLCDGVERSCKCGGCCKHRLREQTDKKSDNEE